nr:uncharacterized protein LOC100176565 [Ciona intestinalis]|eukprot:XP_002121844.1 uncharacterized protein LOC100176565 [Ciona intestinalis]
MAMENQQDLFHFHFSVTPNIVLNRNDNRDIGMYIENAENVTHTVEQPNVSHATSPLQHDSSNPQAHVTHTVDQPSVSQATSSLQDMKFNQQGSRGAVTSRKPTIEEIFGSDDGRLLQEKKYYEAYGVSKNRIQFDPAVIGSKDLVNHYRCCMLAEKGQEAIRIKEQLKNLFKEKFQTTPNEIATFADTIRGEGRDMESILFDQIGAEFYGNQPKAGLVGIVYCAFGIRKSIEAMLSRDKELKPIVRTHVIPLMRDMREMIRRSDDVSEEDRCLQEVWCLNYIGYTEGLVSDSSGCERTLKEAIAIMKRVFGKKAAKYAVYGNCLNSLGDTYRNTSRPNDAYQCYRRAIAAYEKSEDINDDQRARWIGVTKERIKDAKSK